MAHADALGHVYLGLFNLSDAPRTVCADPGTGAGQSLDVWSGETAPYASGEVCVSLAPHASWCGSFLLQGNKPFHSGAFVLY